MATTTHGHEDAHGHTPGLQHHFNTPGQQKEAATLGMWAFLATEIMLFGGIFILLAWGLWLLNRTDLDWMEKWPLAVLIAFIAHCANIVIAIGACAFIDPPFSFPE